MSANELTTAQEGENTHDTRALFFSADHIRDTLVDIGAIPVTDCIGGESEQSDAAIAAKLLDATRSIDSLDHVGQRLKPIIDKLLTGIPLDPFEENLVAKIRRFSATLFKLSTE